MTAETKIRDGLASDAPAIETLYRDAFPEEDLLGIVGKLQQEEAGVLSLVGVSDGALVGHIVFTMCGVATRGADGGVALLGPLAVATASQRRGVGGALIRAGVQRLQNAGVGRICVLGDPAYYGRFGFEPDDRIDPPYPLPEEWRGAWQSLAMSEEGRAFRGALRVPGPWRDPALWAP